MLYRLQYVSITDRKLTTSALCPVPVPAPVTYDGFRSRLASATVCGDTGVVAVMTAQASDNDAQHRDDVDLEFKIRIQTPNFQHRQQPSIYMYTCCVNSELVIMNANFRLGPCTGVF